MKTKIAISLLTMLVVVLSIISTLSFVSSPVVEKIVYKEKIVRVEVPVEKIVYLDKIKYISVGFLDQPVCQVKFNGEKKQNINFVSKPETYSTENSTSSIKYVEKVVYIPGTNSTTIIYVEIPENNPEKSGCNRGYGNGLEICDPGNSANQGNFPFEKESYPKPVK